LNPPPDPPPPLFHAAPPPPPTTSARTELTPVGGVQVQVSTVVNITTTSPEPSEASDVTGLVHVVVGTATA